MTALALNIHAERGDSFRLRVVGELPLRGITGIYGPSGSGKTSLLHTIAGLLPARGEVRVGDVNWQEAGSTLPPHRRSVGYVFQDSRLFPHLDVAGNLAYAWRRRRRSDGPTPAQAATWLAIESLLDQRPDQLSRGQQQRVAIARAAVNAPDVLLLDEPLANIDMKGRRDIIPRLRRLQRELAIAMLYVSHDMAELSQLADWLIVLSQGEIAAQGPLLELSADMDLAMAHEEGAAAIVEATVTHHDADYRLTELELAGQTMYVNATDQPAGAGIRLRLPARDVSLCKVKPEQTSILNVLRVQVDAIEARLDSRVLVRLRIGSQYLLARVTRKSLDALALEPGDAVYAQVKSVALLSDNLAADHV
jgi:molybdate transport system ATP-binding protein